MKYLLRKMTLVVLMGTMFLSQGFAQQNQPSINIDELTLDQIKQFSQEDLLAFPFEELIQLVKKFKLSSIDELYALLLNPTQSTASKMEEDLFSAPLATTVITADELQKSGARSIPEALRLAPGIIVREKTNGNYDVHVRGNDFVPPGSDITNSVNSTTLVMIDHRPVYNSFLGATFWENLPVAIGDIEKIEIIYGPASALYGPNAVSGVIHLITKTPEDEGFTSHFDLQGGNKNTQLAFGSVSFSKGKLGLNLSGNYQNMDRFQASYYVPQLDEYISGDELGDINSQIDTTFNASSTNTDYLNAKGQGAINLGIQYHASDKLSLGYMGSYQSSTVQTSYIDIGSVISSRHTSTFSNNLNLTAGNFDANISGVFGHLNAVEGLPGYEYDFTELNGQLAYHFKYKNLLIRPGLDANYSYYSDESYVDVTENAGLLNGSAELGSVQGSLRLDYTAFNKWRLVGAWMQGYFYKPGLSSSSYQFTSSYKASDNTLLRMVISKANSSPFVLDTYMDKELSVPMPDGNSLGQQMTLLKYGNEDLNPLEMQMFEVGVRHRFMRNLQTDISLFYNAATDYSQLEREESVTSTEDPLGNVGGEQPIDGPVDMASQDIVITETMQNMDVISKQLGVTATVKYVLNEKFNASVFATYQKTTLYDFEVSDVANYNGLTGETMGQVEFDTESHYLTLDHNYTPEFYGGATINYQPGKKWNINASAYGYSQQKTFYSIRQDFKWIEIKGKINYNMKVAYQVNDWMSVYANARNLSNNTSREFIFTDNTGGSYLLGMNIKL